MDLARYLQYFWWTCIFHIFKKYFRIRTVRFDLRFSVFSGRFRITGTLRTRRMHSPLAKSSHAYFQDFLNLHFAGKQISWKRGWYGRKIPSQLTFRTNRGSRRLHTKQITDFMPFPPHGKPRVPTEDSSRPPEDFTLRSTFWANSETRTSLDRTTGNGYGIKGVNTFRIDDHPAGPVPTTFFHDLFGFLLFLISI